MAPHIALDPDRLAALCRRWRVRELSLFGSVLRPDFSPDSDIDVLVTFFEDAPWDLFDFIRMKEELAELFGREIDLIEASALRNPFRRSEILRCSEVVYAA